MGQLHSRLASSRAIIAYTCNGKINQITRDSDTYYCAQPASGRQTKRCHEIVLLPGVEYALLLRAARDDLFREHDVL